MHTSDESFSGSLNYSSISREVPLGENCDALLDIVANEEFLTPIMGSPVFFTLFGVKKRGCHPNLMSLLPCDNNESITSTVRGPSFTDGFTGCNVFAEESYHQPEATCILGAPDSVFLLHVSI